MRLPRIGERGGETMTFREKLMKEHPEKVENTLKIYCSTCPDDYGYEDYFDCPTSLDCRDCWDREMPEEVQK